jgi:hypothetical protein
MSKVVSEFIVPTSPEDIKKLQGAIEESCNSKVRQDAEKALQKEIFETIKEELNIPKKIFNKMVSVYYKANFQEEVAQSEDFQILYEKVMKGKDFSLDTE